MKIRYPTTQAGLTALRAAHPQITWDLGALPPRIGPAVLTGLAAACEAFPGVAQSWAKSFAIDAFQGDRARFWGFTSNDGQTRFNRSHFGAGDPGEWMRIAAHECGHQVLEWCLAHAPDRVNQFLQQHRAALIAQATDYARSSNQPAVEAFCDHCAWIAIQQPKPQPATVAVRAFLATMFP